MSPNKKKVRVEYGGNVSAGPESKTFREEGDFERICGSPDIVRVL